MIRFNTVLNLRVRYIIGLSVIALLVTASFFTIQRLVSEQRNFSTLINLAGHQAGLVDRLINFATVMAATHDASEFGMARGQVGRAINQIRLTHEILLHGDADRGIPKVHNNNLDSIYNELGLNQALANFLQNADFIYDSKMESFTIKSPVYIYVATYGPHILEPLLNAVVDEYDTVGKAAIRKIERFEKIIWLAAIITLVLELIFIFIPLDRHIRKSLSTLESSIKNLTNTRKRLLSAQKWQ